jgi:hypothetical protein
VVNGITVVTDNAGYIGAYSGFSSAGGNSATFGGLAKVTLLGPEMRLENAAKTVDARLGVASFGSAGLGIGTLSDSPVTITTNNTLAATFDSSQNLIEAGNVRAKLQIADQGTACANGDLALSAGWGSTATVTGAAGTGQTCQFTLTSAGTGQAANASITDTLPTALPTANTVCTAQLTGGTGMAALSGAGLFINQTTLSATAPAFTFPGLPVAGSTYFVLIRCGP